jgi:hypothetical protein
MAGAKQTDAEDRARVTALRAALDAGASSLSATAGELAFMAERLGFGDIHTALRKELDGYAPAEQRPYAAIRNDFASWQPLHVLEGKVASAASAAPRNGGAGNISEGIESKRIGQLLAGSRSHVSALAGEMLARLAAREKKPWVISIHGIRTRGNWQKELTEELTPEGFNYKPFDYGFFDIIRFLSPGSRDRKVDEFRDEYSQFHAVHGVRPSVIAHSFGTLIVTRSIEKYGLEFDRLILCGSIVRRDFEWSKWIGTKVTRVLNDFGGRDIWARLVPFAIRDAGQSGLRGFHDTAGGAVVERGNPWMRHSDYFFSFNYTTRWIPFLHGTDPAPTPASTPRKNLRFIGCMTALLAIAAAGIAWWLLRS